MNSGDAAAARDAVNAILDRVDYPQRKDTPGLSSILWTAAKVALAAGDAANAEQYAGDSLVIASRVAPDSTLSADVGQALLLRAKARHAQGNHPAAIDDLQLAIRSLTNGFGEEHPETIEARNLLELIGS
jgi:hypothetical protein